MVKEIAEWFYNIEGAADKTAEAGPNVKRVWQFAIV